jgi:hypothetical protein
MKECQMQLSGPWPPYHFVLRPTHAAHSHLQQTADSLPVASRAPAAASRTTEPSPALA